MLDSMLQILNEEFADLLQNTNLEPDVKATYEVAFNTRLSRIHEHVEYDPALFITLAGVLKSINAAVEVEEQQEQPMHAQAKVRADAFLKLAETYAITDTLKVNDSISSLHELAQQQQTRIISKENTLRPNIERLYTNFIQEFQAAASAIKEEFEDYIPQDYEQINFDDPEAFQIEFKKLKAELKDSDDYDDLKAAGDDWIAYLGMLENLESYRAYIPELDYPVLSSLVEFLKSNELTFKELEIDVEAKEFIQGWNLELQKIKDSDLSSLKIVLTQIKGLINIMQSLNISALSEIKGNYPAILKLFLNNIKASSSQTAQLFSLLNKSADVHIFINALVILSAKYLYDVSARPAVVNEFAMRGQQFADMIAAILKAINSRFTLNLDPEYSNAILLDIARMTLQQRDNFIAIHTVNDDEVNELNSLCVRAKEMNEYIKEKVKANTPIFETLNSSELQKKKEEFSIERLTLLEENPDIETCIQDYAAFIELESICENRINAINKKEEESLDALIVDLLNDLPTLPIEQSDETSLTDDDTKKTNNLPPKKRLKS